MQGCWTETGANILLQEGYIPTYLLRVNILPSKGRHLALLHHLVLLLAYEEQLLHLQPTMTVHHPTPSPPQLHHHVKGGLHLCSGPTTSCPRDASSTRTSHSSTRTSARSMTASSQDQAEQVQSCAVLVGEHGGCLVTSVSGVAAWLPLGQCPLWGLFGVLVCTLGP